jgi:hypothetical protein
MAQEVLSLSYLFMYGSKVCGWYIFVSWFHIMKVMFFNFFFFLFFFFIFFFFVFIFVFFFFFFFKKRSLTGDALFDSLSVPQLQGWLFLLFFYFPFYFILFLFFFFF